MFFNQSIIKKKFNLKMWKKNRVEESGAEKNYSSVLNMWQKF